MLGAGRLFVYFPHEMMSFLSMSAGSPGGRPRSHLTLFTSSWAGRAPLPLLMAGDCGISAYPLGTGCGRRALQKPVRKAGPPPGTCANPPGNRLKIDRARGVARHGTHVRTYENTPCGSSSCSSRNGLPRSRHLANTRTEGTPDLGLFCQSTGARWGYGTFNSLRFRCVLSGFLFCIFNRTKKFLKSFSFQTKT